MTTKGLVPYSSQGHTLADARQELVWSGAKLVDNRNTWDFKLATFNNSPALTFILGSERRASGNSKGAGIILNTLYQVLDNVNFTDEGDVMDIHEFKLINGRTSLTVFMKKEEVNLSSLRPPLQEVTIVQAGFREIDVHTGNVNFERPTNDHISMTESMTEPPEAFGSPKVSWDASEYSTDFFRDID
jgi:hypothetical protein